MEKNHIREIAERQSAVPESAWEDLLSTGGREDRFPGHPEHHGTGKVATIVIPVAGEGEEFEFVLYEVGSGLNKGRIGFPGGQVELKDFPPLYAKQGHQPSYAFGGSPALTLRALRNCGARELQEETGQGDKHNKVGGLIAPPNKLALACFYSILYSPDPNNLELQKTQQVATLAVDISNTSGPLDSPGSEVRSLGLFSPGNALDRMTDPRVPAGNRAMFKRALMMIALYKQSTPTVPVYSGKISYPKGEGWKNPIISQGLVYPAGHHHLW